MLGRLALFGKLLIVGVVATIALIVVAPSAGLVAAIVLSVVLLTLGSHGYLGGGAEMGHETWVNLESERKHEALRRHD